MCVCVDMSAALAQRGRLYFAEAACTGCIFKQNAHSLTLGEENGKE